MIQEQTTEESVTKVLKSLGAETCCICGSLMLEGEKEFIMKAIVCRPCKNLLNITKIKGYSVPKKIRLSKY